MYSIYYTCLYKCVYFVFWKWFGYHHGGSWLFLQDPNLHEVIMRPMTYDMSILNQLHQHVLILRLSASQMYIIVEGFPRHIILYSFPWPEKNMGCCKRNVQAGWSLCRQAADANIPSKGARSRLKHFKVTTRVDQPFNSSMNPSMRSCITRAFIAWTRCFGTLGSLWAFAQASMATNLSWQG